MAVSHFTRASITMHTTTQHRPATKQRRRPAAPRANLYMRSETSAQAHPRGMPKRPFPLKTDIAPATKPPKPTTRRKKPTQPKPKKRHRETTVKSNLQDRRHPRKQASQPHRLTRPF